MNSRGLSGRVSGIGEGWKMETDCGIFGALWEGDFGRSILTFLLFIYFIS